MVTHSLSSEEALSTILLRLGEALGVDSIRFVGLPESGGWSSTTLLLEDSSGLGYVLRLTPQGDTMFEDHDLKLQADAMLHVRQHGLPAPRILLTDWYGAVLGRPGYVMEHVHGQVPWDSKPTFAEEGFLVDASAAEQRTYQESLLGVIAQLHSCPLPSFDIKSKSPKEQLRDLWVQLQESGYEPAGILHEAFSELDATSPLETIPRVMLWGDARPANTVVNDQFEVSGMLDWELASIGQAEHDVAWLLEMNRMRAPEDQGLTLLPGFMQDEECWSFWENLVGRPAENRVWYTRHAAFRVAVYLTLNLVSLVKRGDLPSNHRLLEDNRTFRRLRGLF